MPVLRFNEWMLKLLQLLARQCKEKTTISLPMSNVLELSKELWDVWSAAKEDRVAVMAQE